MRRRRFLLLAVAAAPALAAETSRESARGTLTLTHDGRPVLQTSDSKAIFLQGDESTMGVLRDERLRNSDFLVLGKFDGPDHFTIDPIHKRAMFVLKDGKQFTISYWCEVCAIRTYSPGKCACCQQETNLDLREKP